MLVVDPIPLQILLGTFTWDPIEKIWSLGLAIALEIRPRKKVRPGFTLVVVTCTISYPLVRYEVIR